MKSRVDSQYAWIFLAFVFALNLSGVGKDYQTEFQITWVILSLIGLEISSNFKNRGKHDE